MPKFANYFATVSEEGRITLLGEAYPVHELLPNQIMLTGAEWSLLHAVKSLEEAKKMIGSIEHKVKKVTNGEG